MVYKLKVHTSTVDSIWYLMKPYHSPKLKINQIYFVLFCNIWFYFRHWQRFSAASFVWRSWGMPISALIVPSCVVMSAFAVGWQNNVHNVLTVEHHFIFMNWSTVVGLKKWHSSWIPCKQWG